MRRSSVAPTLCGTGRSVTADTVRASRSARSFPISMTNSGMPAVISCTVAASTGRAPSPRPVTAASTRATSSIDSPSGTRRIASPSATRRVQSEPAAEVAEPLVLVAMMRIRPRLRWRARCSSSCRVEGSASWMSSSTRTAPAGAATALRSVATASKRRYRLDPAPASPMRGRSNPVAPRPGKRSTRKAAPAPARSWSSLGGSPETYSPMASTKGRYGMRAWLAVRPRRTAAPSAAAKPAISVARRVEPRPSSASITTSCRWPAAARFQASRSTPSSRSRPTNGSVASRTGARSGIAMRGPDSSSVGSWARMAASMPRNPGPGSKPSSSPSCRYAS